MSAITTHVLDAVLGKPAAGVRIRLERREAEKRAVDKSEIDGCEADRRQADRREAARRKAARRGPDRSEADRREADRRETDRREAERCDAGQWVEVGASATDADGRCRDLTKDVEAGVYRLTFSTGAYLEGQGRTGIYPEISITFNCGGEANYHLPLLLSDNSYTTYRGS
jgi:5-hydroxyisourate hydrolase